MCIDEEVFKRVRPSKIRDILAGYYAAPKARSAKREERRNRHRTSHSTTQKKKPAARKMPPGVAAKGVKVHG